MDGSITRAGAPVAVEPYAEPAYAENDTFGLQDAKRVLLRRRMTFGAVFGAITLIGTAFALLRPPEYEATAVLMMRPSEPRVDATETPRATPPDNGYVQSQVEILRSSGLARQVAARQQISRSAADDISVERRDGTYIVEITARSNDPEQAAQTANDLINVYFQSREQARVDNAAQTSDWLNGRLNELRSEVQMREAEVERYRAQNGLLTIDGSMLAEQQLRDAEAAVVAARSDMAERNARYRQVSNMVGRGGSAESTAGALSSETMAGLRSRQADVTRRLAEYSERYGELHPQVQSARAERDDIDRQIRAESQRIAQNLGDEAQIAAARVSTLQSHLSSVRGQLVGDNSAQVRMRELERAAQATRAVYENFLLRSNEVNGAAGLGGDAQVVARATTPTEPASRSPLILILLAAALGAIAGALAAFLSDQFSTTLQSADDVRTKVGVPLLTSIPQLPSRSIAALPAAEQHPAGYLIEKPFSAFAEAMRMLRARIMFANPASPVKVVAVTSATAREGKSSTALSLARMTALSGRKAIILDCDLRRRSLNHMLCIEPRRGIADVLRGRANWRELTGRDEYSNADVLPAAAEDAPAEDLFNTEAMQNLVGELRSLYDLVVLDCPPTLALAEVRNLAVLADGVVIVARRNQTEIGALRTALNELAAVNAKVVGVAFNGADPKAAGRVSYADPLYFSHGMQGYYLD